MSKKRNIRSNTSRYTNNSCYSIVYIPIFNCVSTYSCAQDFEESDDEGEDIEESAEELLEKFNHIQGIYVKL